MRDTLHPGGAPLHLHPPAAAAASQRHSSASHAAPTPGACAAPAAASSMVPGAPTAPPAAAPGGGCSHCTTSAPRHAGGSSRGRTAELRSAHDRCRTFSAPAREDGQRWAFGVGPLGGRVTWGQCLVITLHPKFGGGPPSRGARMTGAARSARLRGRRGGGGPPTWGLWVGGRATWGKANVGAGRRVFCLD
jgi:hypothetical protein